MNKGKISLSKLVFMALCCDMGIFLKKLIAPAANIITEALHIPGGIGTSFSIMFVIVGASICDFPGCATLMSIVQSFIAVAVGTTGSMGILAPIGYIVPGIVIDIIFWIIKKIARQRTEYVMFANALAGLSAAICANMITFRLSGPPLWLYASVAFTSGIISGLLGASLVTRLRPILCKEDYMRQGD